MSKLVITIEGEYSDLDYLRSRVVGAVEDEVELSEDHLDEQVEVAWEWAD